MPYHRPRVTPRIDLASVVLLLVLSMTLMGCATNAPLPPPPDAGHANADPPLADEEPLDIDYLRGFRQGVLAALESPNTTFCLFPSNERKRRRAEGFDAGVKLVMAARRDAAREESTRQRERFKRFLESIEN